MGPQYGHKHFLRWTMHDLQQEQIVRSLLVWLNKIFIAQFLVHRPLGVSEPPSPPLGGAGEVTVVLAAQSAYQILRGILATHQSYLSLAVSEGVKGAGLHLKWRCSTLCDIPCCFLTGPWTVTRSSLRMLRRVAAFCQLLRPVFPLVALVEPSSWRTGVVLVAVGVIPRPVLPTPLRILVVHHLPRCVSVGMWSVGLLFLHRAQDSHPFFPARATSARCILTATAV